MEHDSAETTATSGRPRGDEWPAAVGVFAVASVLVLFAPVIAICLENLLISAGMLAGGDVSGLYAVGMLFGQITSVAGVVVAGAWLASPIQPMFKTALRIALAAGVVAFGGAASVMGGLWSGRP